jgi:hypothetical protein
MGCTRVLLVRYIPETIGFSDPTFAGMSLSGHPKTGQRWSPQNRPTGRRQDSISFTPVGPRASNDFVDKHATAVEHEKADQAEAGAAGVHPAEE